MENKPINKVIKCPFCGYEYLPAEIFMPEDIIGKPKNIIRDALGKILYVEYDKTEEQELTQHFMCDGCDRQFVVTVDSTFKVSEEDEERDFSQPYVSLL